METGPLLVFWGFFSPLKRLPLGPWLDFGVGGSVGWRIAYGACVALNAATIRERNAP